MDEMRIIRRIAFPQMPGEMPSGSWHIWTQKIKKQQAGIAVTLNAEITGVPKLNELVHEWRRYIRMVYPAVEVAGAIGPRMHDEHRASAHQLGQVQQGLHKLWLPTGHLRCVALPQVHVNLQVLPLQQPGENLKLHDDNVSLQYDSGRRNLVCASKGA
eukprot:1928946-Pleurochrysis_carterae.AAC.2